MEVKETPIGEIVPYWRNPRNNEEAVAGVKDSIQTYGFNVPIVVDREGVIVAGHTRYKAALQLGLETVPVVTADLDEEKAKAFRIADNKVSEKATWDNEALGFEMRELGEWGEVPGFSEMELSRLLGDAVGGQSNIQVPTGGFSDIPTFGEDSGEATTAPTTAPEQGNQVPPTTNATGHHTTPEQVERQEDKLDNRFADQSAKTQTSYIDLECPHCGEQYTVSKDEVLRR